MKATGGKEIAKRLIALNVNLICWSRGHLEQAFQVNGKGEGEKLTIQQFHLMVHILEANLNTVSDLAQALHLSKSSTSLAVTKLVSKGHLRREEPMPSEDGRKSYFFLTEKGEKAVENTQNIFMEIVAGYFEHLEEDAKTLVCGHLDGINQLLVSGGSKR